MRTQNTIQITNKFLVKIQITIQITNSFFFTDNHPVKHELFMERLANPDINYQSKKS